MPRSDSPPPRGWLAAMFHPWTWKMAWRDSRSQRTRLLLASLALVSGIASLVAIQALKTSVDRGIRSQAKALLGSDFQISSRRPLDEGELQRLPLRVAAVSRETILASMARNPSNDETRLVQVRGMESGYPFYGQVLTDPPQAFAELHTVPDGILLESSVAEQLGAKTHDPIQIGSASLRLLGTIRQGAPRANRFSGFAPEAYVRLDTLRNAGLLGSASLAQYFAHFKLHPGLEDRAAEQKVRDVFPETEWRIETPAERRQDLGRALDHFQRFLGILALASLALGALGVASALQAHLKRRLPTIAILRCLGCSSQSALAVYFAQTLLIGLVGTLLGAAIGAALQVGTLVALRDQLPVGIPLTPAWSAIVASALGGLAVCLGFSLLPLSQVRRVSPLDTLRGPLSRQRLHPFSTTLFALFALGLLFTLSWLSGTPPRHAAAATAGLAVAFLVLALTAKSLTWLAKRLPRPSWPFTLRHGLAQLHRPGNHTTLFATSIGLATFLLLTVHLTGHLVRNRLQLGRHAESPNLYLIDVQPDQVDGVRQTLARQNLPALEAAPMVTMRIGAINGTPIRERTQTPRWIARREFRSTYRDHLSPSEKLVAGSWFQGPSSPDQTIPLSLEQGIAKDLDVQLGDRLTLDVQGLTLETEVTSLREVDWGRFNLNFFMVFPPGVLEDAPGFHVVTTRAPDAAASGLLQRHLIRDFPNVTAIDLSAILETVGDILRKISYVVTLLASSTLLAGIPIAIGSLLQARDQRLRESVILRTLGASGPQIRQILSVEYIALGAVAALAASLLAAAAHAILALTVFEASPLPPFLPFLVALAAASVFSGLAGAWLSRRASRSSPLSILRSETA